ncbi:protein of unknown function [Moritella yayanosii]|uniref:Uncharacterized protein n=1 Tax=Moritella yayanosii TaxID=69539 RepID=A0A330LT96_9GAMM|nr:protein of unknown function [Moritella yayanosii]
MVKQADLAMYEIKRRGKNNYGPQMGVCLNLGCCVRYTLESNS